MPTVDFTYQDAGYRLPAVVLEYLEVIYTLGAESQEAYAVTLAELFGVSRANASATVSRLVRDGLAQVDERRIGLTGPGRMGAEIGLRRHRVAERFLVDVLGMPWASVHEQARSFESGLTPLLQERMDKRAGFPRTCPHGNPIPRPDLDAAGYLHDQGALRLREAPIGAPLRLLAISKLIEHQPALMDRIGAWDLRPGSMLSILAREGALGAVELQAGQARRTAETTLASRLWVVPA
jgi:DtxR family transcriptional regulator, iron-dependent repressor